MRFETGSDEDIPSCEATTVPVFVQQLAVSILRHGYFWYVTGQIPEVKDPRVIDGKILRVYGINVSKFVRHRRKQLGQANIQYLRHERFFVLAATKGEHHFYRDERESIRDARIYPIYYRGYSISHRSGHSSVRIENAVYLRLKAYLLGIALRRSVEHLEWEFSRIPYEPFAPVRSQLLSIHRAVNKARATAGLPPVTTRGFRFWRKPVKPFEAQDVDASEVEECEDGEGDESAERLGDAILVKNLSLP